MWLTKKSSHSPISNYPILVPQLLRLPHHRAITILKSDNYAMIIQWNYPNKSSNQKKTENKHIIPSSFKADPVSPVFPYFFNARLLIIGQQPQKGSREAIAASQASLDVPSSLAFDNRMLTQYWQKSGFMGVIVYWVINMVFKTGFIFMYMKNMDSWIVFIKIHGFCSGS